jgi:hypothetical protein
VDSQWYYSPGAVGRPPLQAPSVLAQHPHPQRERLMVSFLDDPFSYDKSQSGSYSVEGVRHKLAFLNDKLWLTLAPWWST